jgi:hypothetical protein
MKLEIRRWHGGERTAHEVIVDHTGIAVRPDGGWHPRPTAVARVVAGVLDVPAGDGPPPFDGTPREWRSLVDAAVDDIGLADVRCDGASVLVLAWRDGGGMVEVVPTTDGLVRCEPRHPLEVWTGLTSLARDVSRGTRR